MELPIFACKIAQPSWKTNMMSCKDFILNFFSRCQIFFTPFKLKWGTFLNKTWSYYFWIYVKNIQMYFFIFPIRVVLEYNIFASIFRLYEISYFPNILIHLWQLVHTNLTLKIMQCLPGVLLIQYQSWGVRSYR